MNRNVASWRFIREYLIAIETRLSCQKQAYAALQGVALP